MIQAMTRTAFLLRNGALLGIAAYALPAQAQQPRSGQDAADAVATGAADASQEAGQPDIVVTATKRAERLVDTPQSITAVTSADLSRLAATQFRDFAATVPGLSFTTAGAGNTQITLRGVTAGSDVGSTVALYIDEVPFGSSGPFAQANSKILDTGLFDLDRIEVLRGPQGTLYGASSLGGLIRYITKMPDAGSASGTLRAGIGAVEHGAVDLNLAGAFNIPLVADRLALRAGAYEFHDGGYIHNVRTGRRAIGRSDIYGGRLDLLFTPSDRLSVRLNALLQNSKRTGDATADYTYAGAMPYGSLGQSRALAEDYDQKFRMVAGTLTYDLGGADLTSVSAYQTFRTHYVADVSYAYVPLFVSLYGRQFGAVGYPVAIGVDKFTQEVRLTSSGRRALEWQIGGFYTHQDTTNLQQLAFYDAALTPVPAATPQYFIYDNPSTYREIAGFGDLTWHATDRLELTGGVRVAKSKLESEISGSGTLVRPRPSTSSSSTAVTYLANALYHITNTTNAYFRFATGYRPGGPNYGTIDTTTGQAIDLPPFKADRLKSYEVGIKGATSDRRLGFDLSIYNVDWNDIQLSVTRGGLGVIANAAGATIRGGEVAVTARPDQALTLSGSLAYIDAKLDAASTDLKARKGERLPNVPHLSATLNADYVIGARPIKPTLGATFRYIGTRYSGFSGSATQHRLPGYSTVDARAGFTLAVADGADVQVQLFVHNLLDKRGQVGLLLPQFGPRVSVEKPRTFGLNVTANF